MGVMAATRAVTAAIIATTSSTVIIYMWDKLAYRVKLRHYTRLFMLLVPRQAVAL